MPSLQDQLLNAGLVDKKKVKQLGKEKRQNAKQNKGKPQIDEAKLAAERALAEKAARDREINQQRNAEAERKAIAAQIVQLISVNKLDRRGGETAYQFSDGKKIKKLLVSELQYQQLVKGLIAVTRLREGYELVPAAIAEKIQQRDASAVLVLNTQSKETLAEDDPYADYQIPDDLMW